MSDFFDSKISRRRLLNRLSLAGAGLYLPFLKTLEAQAQAGGAPKRVIFIALQHGWQRVYQEGKSLEPVAVQGTMKNNGLHAYSDSFTFVNAFAPLNELKNKTTFVDGLRPGPFWGNAHDRSYTNMLTCSVPAGEGDSAVFPVPLNESIDHYIARKTNTNVLRLSSDYASWGQPFHPMSWDQNLNKLAYHTSPLSAFNAVIGNLRIAANGTSIAPAVDMAAIKDKHVFAALKEDIQILEKQLGSQSKPQFQRYLSLMEDLNKKMTNNGAAGGASDVSVPAAPQNGNRVQNLDSYYDLLVATTAMGTHPISVLGIGQSNEDSFIWTDENNVKHTGYPTSGDFHHHVAHNGNPRIMAGWAAWNVAEVVKFAKRLDQIVDSDGKTVLDNTMIVLIGEVGDGQHDDRYNGVPIIGGGWGKLVGNRYIRLPTFDARNRQGYFWGAKARNGARVESTISYGLPVGIYTFADLWTTMADMAGHPVGSWGHDVYNFGKLRLG